jgi:hypothetical protein
VCVRVRVGVAVGLAVEADGVGFGVLFAVGVGAAFFTGSGIAARLVMVLPLLLFVPDAELVVLCGFVLAGAAGALDGGALTALRVATGAAAA